MVQVPAAAPVSSVLVYCELEGEVISLRCLGRTSIGGSASAWSASTSSVLPLLWMPCCCCYGCPAESCLVAAHIITRVILFTHAFSAPGFLMILMPLMPPVSLLLTPPITRNATTIRTIVNRTDATANTITIIMGICRNLKVAGTFTDVFGQLNYFD